ncbi:MAG: 6-pyruvoyl-tetrahydropterin synthase-related protein [Pseudomonadota bacterium]
MFATTLDGPITVVPHRAKANTFRRPSILFRPHNPANIRDVGGAAGYRPRVRSAYSVRVYRHSCRSSTANVGRGSEDLKSEVPMDQIDHPPASIDRAARAGGGQRPGIGALADLAARPWVAIGILCAVTAVLFAPYVLHGPPMTHSSFYNTVWASAFGQAMAEQGTLYPRWLGAMWNGAGAQDFFFYAPLPFWLSSLPVMVFAATPAEGIVFAGALCRLLSGIGMLHLGRALGMSPRAGLAAAVILMLMPYHVIDWTMRGALGEVVAMAALPWGLAMMIDALQRGRGLVPLALLTAWIVLAHLPSFLIFLCSAIAVVMLCCRHLSLKRIAFTAAAGALGVLLASVYWLPALWLLDTVSVEQMQVYHWSNNVLALPGEDLDGLHGRVSGTVWLMTIGAAVLLMLTTPRRTPATIFALCLGILTLVMMSSLSRPLWEYTPLAMIQFPWRFMLVFEIAVALVVAIAMARPAASWTLRTVLRRACVALMVVGLLYAGTWPGEKTPRERDVTWVAHGVGPVEWLGAPRSEGALMTDALFTRLQDTTLLSGTGTFTVRLVTGQQIVFDAACPVACDLEVFRQYWSFWRLTDGEGREVTLRPAPPDGFPFITARLPAGTDRYRLVLETPGVVPVGWAITGAAAIALLWWGALSWRETSSGASISRRSLRRMARG